MLYKRKFSYRAVKMIFHVILYFELDEFNFNLPSNIGSMNSANKKIFAFPDTLPRKRSSWICSSDYMLFVKEKVQLDRKLTGLSSTIIREQIIRMKYYFLIGLFDRASIRSAFPIIFPSHNRFIFSN